MLPHRDESRRMAVRLNCHWQAEIIAKAARDSAGRIVSFWLCTRLPETNQRIAQKCRDGRGGLPTAISTVAITSPGFSPFYPEGHSATQAMAGLGHAMSFRLYFTEVV